MRRYTELRPSAGTTWPPAVRRAIRERDRGCAGPAAGMPGDCHYALEIDHVRASGGLGMKSRSTVDNGVVLCGFHHQEKTRYGREYRPMLLRYIEDRARPEPCIFDECVSTDRHTHGGFPGGYDNPDDPDGPPIEFTTDPAPGVRDYNGALLPPQTTEHDHVEPVHGCLACYELEA